VKQTRTARRSRAEIFVGTIGQVLVGLAAVAGLVLLILWLVGRGDDDGADRPAIADGPRPEITVTSEDASREVGPWVFCDPVRPDLCDEEGDVIALPVAPDAELTVAVPEEFGEVPWVLESFYLEVDEAAADQHGGGESLVGDEQAFGAGQTDPVTVPGTDDQGRELAGIEVRLPTGILLVDEESGTEEEQIVSHAVWSVRTR